MTLISEGVPLSVGQSCDRVSQATALLAAALTGAECVAGVPQRMHPDCFSACVDEDPLLVEFLLENGSVL
jgi:hypothetical protein